MIVRPITKVNTTLDAPSSKAHSLRAIFICALAYGTSTLKNLLLAKDQLVALKIIQQMGAKVTKKGDIMIDGIEGRPRSSEFYVEDSGFCARVMATIAGLSPYYSKLYANKTLSKRPMRDIYVANKSLGLDYLILEDNMPVKIKGPLIGGETELKGEKSSQFFSSILISAPYAKEEVILRSVGKISSRPYIDLTIDVMKDFGVDVRNYHYKKFKIKPQKYKAREYNIEGDYTNASYFMAAAAITKGTARIRNLRRYSSQGDKFFLDILREMGCEVSWQQDYVMIRGPEKLRPVIVDMNYYPDIVPSVAVVSAFASGKSEITNIGHLRYKESDRLANLCTELKKTRIRCEVVDDGLVIEGGRPRPAEIETYDDHRMAMAFGTMGLKTGMQINDPFVVDKSFPDFWKVLERI